MTDQTHAEALYPDGGEVRDTVTDYMDDLLAEEKVERDKVEAAQAVKDNAGVTEAVRTALAEQSEQYSESLSDALLEDAKAQMVENQKTFSADDLSYVGANIPEELANNPLIASPAFIKMVLAQRKETTS